VRLLRIREVLLIVKICTVAGYSHIIRCNINNHQFLYDKDF